MIAIRTRIFLAVLHIVAAALGAGAGAWIFSVIAYG